MILTNAKGNDNIRQCYDGCDLLEKPKRKCFMVYHGKVKNGVVVFEKATGLPDGTEVRVEPFSQDENIVVDGPTPAEQFADVIGIVPDLPSDMAAQHDHYLHGAPKQ
jgi:hypothetical protein